VLQIRSMEKAWEEKGLILNSGNYRNKEKYLQ
jgi:hypothetical protein